METFRRGEIVRLKSGGPDMTIVGIGDNSMRRHLAALMNTDPENRPSEPSKGDVEYSYLDANDYGLECKWFSGKKLESGKFYPDTIEKVKGGQDN